MNAEATNNKWRPGWPWEMEILAAVFALAASLLPIFTSWATPPSYGTTLSAVIQQPVPAAAPNEDLIVNIFWAGVIAVMYAVHLLAARYLRGWITVPLTHLFAPLVFAALALYRLCTYAPPPYKRPLLNASVTTCGFWALGIVCLWFLTGQATRWRHLRRFRYENWLVDSPTALDASFLALVPLLRPLLYPPVRYKLSEEGILIEGINYAMSLPLEIVQTVERATLPGMASGGFFLATSARKLATIRLKGWSDPIYISPRQRDAFVTQAFKLIDSRRPATKCGTRPGTRAGVRPHTRPAVLAAPKGNRSRHGSL